MIYVGFVRETFAVGELFATCCFLFFLSQKRLLNQYVSQTFLYYFFLAESRFFQVSISVKLKPFKVKNVAVV